MIYYLKVTWNSDQQTYYLNHLDKWFFYIFHHFQERQILQKYLLAKKYAYKWSSKEIAYKSKCQGPEVLKLFSCSTQLSTNFILLINFKMPTIVGILTFISMINTTSERFKVRHFFICRYFSFYEQLKVCAPLSCAWKKFHNLGAWRPQTSMQKWQ